MAAFYLFLYFTFFSKDANLLLVRKILHHTPYFVTVNQMLAFSFLGGFAFMCIHFGLFCLF